MYKKLVYLTLTLSMMVSGFILTGCNKTQTYAELLDAEKSAIRSYIKKNNIIVLSTFPTDSIFGEKEYFLDGEGLYIHIDTLGDNHHWKFGEMVLLRYEKRGPLPADSIVFSNINYETPDEMTYTDSYGLNIYGIAPYAWFRPLKWVGIGGKVKLIAPHAAGNTTDQSNVQAYVYDIEYKKYGPID